MVKITTNQTCETRREQIREGIDSVIERHNNVFQPETPLPWDEIFPSARAPLTRNRLGIWMHPVSMYPPFVPYPLPPPIRYDDELNALIAEAERAIAMLDQTARVRHGDIDQAIRECSINEAPHEPGNPCFSYLAGCVSCYTGTENALRWGFEQICGGSPITAGMVREIHARASCTRARIPAGVKTVIFLPDNGRGGNRPPWIDPNRSKNRTKPNQNEPTRDARE